MGDFKVGGIDSQLYKKSINGQGSTKGVNPFEGQSAAFRGGGPEARGPEALDTQMLAQKKAGFEVGLGGTNNPDDHKIFYAA